MIPDPILITGCARSGTSMVAGAVHLCGAFGGLMSGPNRSNQKGMFENHKVRETICKPYLESIGADRLGQYPLPSIEKLTIPQDWKDRVLKIMTSQGYNEGPWMYKGAKMCLVWPIWHYAFPNAKWIIVRRDKNDIADSCIKTSFMKAFGKQHVMKAVGVKNERDGWLWWIRQHEERFIEMINSELNCRMIWPSRMVRGDYAGLMQTIEWLGLKWNSDVLSFIDPKLYHSRKKESENGQNNGC